jgi:3-phosphoshikimate 1-carboxyvinyltransferase
LSGAAAPSDPLPVAPADRPVAGSIRVPGSKSQSNRHLILAALAGGSTTLRGLLACDDCDRLRAALDACGVRFEDAGDDGSGGVGEGAGARSVRLTPAAPVVGTAAAPVSLHLGDGGTPTRFMIAYAAAQPAGVFVIDGSARMRERPVAEGVAMLRALGARIEYAESEGRLPVRVFGGTLRGGAIEVGRTASSQFVSALLLVAPRLAQGIDIRLTEEPTSASYLHLSLAALAAVGVDAETAYGPVRLGVATIGGGLARIRVAPQPIRGGTVDIEPDASSAVYPAAAAVLTGGSVLLEGLPRRNAQPDSYFIEDLALRGARVEALGEGGDDGEGGGEDAGGRPRAVATRISAGPVLRGLDSDYARAPDAAVMAMVLAACGDRPSRFTGLGTLRVKESDRIAAVAAGLRALGGTVDCGEDWALVHPLPARPTPAAIDTVNDHRIAMAFAVLGLARPGVSIRNPACVGKSWPGFWLALDALCRENSTR